MKKKTTARPPARPPRKPEGKFADLVFEGGGVKGIGLVGALSVVEAEGYAWRNVAGTSAGAIVASLAAAGYSSAELKGIVGGLDYIRFKDKGWLDRVPVAGKFLSVLMEKGVYEGDYFESWIGELLARRDVRTFRDLVIDGEEDPRYRYRLNVVASDVSNGLLAVLPQAAERYGVRPDDLSVARAVRMSMSIPFFFEPVRLGGATFVDGGILSNFPVWLFDAPGRPSWPTFGFKLIEPESGRPNKVDTVVDFARAILTTMMDAHDKMHVENEDFVRTIPIPTLGVRTTEFDLSPERRDALYESGVKAGRDFFKAWDFQNYVRKYRVRRAANYLRKVARLRKGMAAG